MPLAKPYFANNHGPIFANRYAAVGTILSMDAKGVYADYSLGEPSQAIAIRPRWP
jgi:hypothetical protein